jgi:hypothetical protein
MSRPKTTKARAPVRGRGASKMVVGIQTQAGTGRPLGRPLAGPLRRVAGGFAI